MTEFVFFALAKHHRRYFQQLIEHTEIKGRVVGVNDLPLPSPKQFNHVIDKVDWHRLVNDKCQERQVKGKRTGAVYRGLLRLELFWVALRLAAFFARNKPDAVVMWNGSNRHCQLLCSLLPPAVDTWYVENGLLPDTTTLDPKGVNYLNSVPRNVSFYRTLNVPSDWDIPRRDLVPRNPRVVQGTPLVLPARYIFVPFQDSRDSQIRLFSPWIANMRELFKIMQRISEVSGWTIVFKEHPSSRESYPDLRRLENERLIFANANSTQQLIEQSEMVITINSTVGLESILLDKPVVTLGNAFYNVPGLVMHAKDADEVLTIVERTSGWRRNAPLRRAFLYYLADMYCIPGDWRQPDEAHWSKVARRLKGRKEFANAHLYSE